MRSFIAGSAAVLMVVAALFGQSVRAATPAASKIPVKAHLSASAVHPGDTISIDLVTVKYAVLVMHVAYPGGTGFNSHGKTDSKGHWKHKWIVRATQAGAASAGLLIKHGSQHRNYTLHFQVIGIPTSTATATSTATSSPTPTSTGTSTATPTFTLTPTATLTPTPTNTLTATATPSVSVTPTPTATSTMTPTPTATATSTSTGGTAVPTSTPAGPPTVVALMSNSTPAVGDHVVSYGEFSLGSGDLAQPVANVPMTATWHFKTGDQTCTATTDVNGTAGCSLPVGAEEAGFKVNVDVAFVYQGQTYKASTSFTPQ